MADYQERIMRGTYSHGAIKGTFEGPARIFPDGKLVAVHVDTGADVVLSGGHPKLVFGRKDQEGNIAFWKVMNHPSIYPLVYSTKLCGDGYEGVWRPLDIFVDNFVDGFLDKPALPALAAAFDEKSVAGKLDALGSLSLESINQHLQMDFVDYIYRLQDGSQRGRFTLLTETSPYVTLN